MSKHRKLSDYPKELRGFPQNRYSGHNTLYEKTYGGSFEAASECRTLTPDEKKAIEERLRKEGALDPCPERARKASQ